MFNEIESELMSILSDDPIERIVHAPTIDIAKTMELLFKINYSDIKRVYTEENGSINRMTVIHNSKNSDSVDHDLCPINGKVYHITFFPSSLLNKDENNAISLSRAIISYVSCRVELIMDTYRELIKRVDDNLLKLIIIQATPVITCAVMRKLYAGPTLSKVIYMSLTELINVYKNIYTEEGINSILNLFDEGLGTSELLDSGFICSIPVDDKKYPGIWANSKKEDSN